MSRSAAELAQRRQQLLAESAARREELHVYAQGVNRQLNTLETGLNFASRIWRQPFLMAGIVLGLAWLKPQRYVQPLKSAWSIWNSAQKFMPIVMPLVQNLFARKNKP